MMNKDLYVDFCNRNFVPIFSQPWWMDAVCLSENWDVWLYKKNNSILAAMPYYIEKRGKNHEYKYITKAPLTQNNGIIFSTSAEKNATKASFEQEVINAACEYIKTLSLDVYEQQYQTSFVNWQPFFWNGYTAHCRYTYRIIENDVDLAWTEVTSNYRKNIKKGWSNTSKVENISPSEFYKQQKMVFGRQGIDVPFSYEKLFNIYLTARDNSCINILAALDDQSNIAASILTVSDERTVYLLMGGANPEKAHLQCYNSLIWDCVSDAMQQGKVFDFEGSMHYKIARSYREFGGLPTPYFRIRKVFNPQIIRLECEEELKILEDVCL